MNDEVAQGTEDGPRVVRAGAVLDPRVALATSMHASAGVYALLLGSGVSIGAGIKTGWDIVKDLISRAATAQDPEHAGAGQAAAEDPETWYREHCGDGPLGYSALLTQVAKTPADRQAVLKSYFEPQPDQAGESAAIVPGAAHRAIAQLVLRGSIRVILTTNFDRLTERALEEVGISPQVIHSPEQYDAATPLVHSRATVIKLHGDYLDLQLRNTVEELTDYPAAQQDLLNRVLDEYGLIVCGWSGDWDHALVRAVEGTRSRRYPLYWSHLGPLGEAARKLTAQHAATLIPGVTADQFFQDLQQRLEALDHMAELPISRDMAVTRLKKALPHPARHIDLFDMVDQAVSDVIRRADPQRYPIQNPDRPYESYIRGYRADSDALLHLLAAGAFHDDGTYAHLWVRAVKRLTGIRGSMPSMYATDFESLRHFPALLATWTAGVASVLGRREELLARLLIEPTYKWPFGRQPTLPAAIYLNPVHIISGDQLNQSMSPPSGGSYAYPHSRYLRLEAREPLRAVEPDDSAYEAACDRLELLATMIAFDNKEIATGLPVWFGAFLTNGGLDDAEHGLAARVAREVGGDWPPIRAGAFGGEPARAAASLQAFHDWRTNNPHWR